ncbi:MAG: hypothetical protein WA624_15015 [Methylocella sp.]
MDGDTPQSKGGKARADKLSKDELREIASLGAQRRREKVKALTDSGALPKATHQGKMTVGTLELDCSGIPQITGNVPSAYH